MASHSGGACTSPGAIATAVPQQRLRSMRCFCYSRLMNAAEAQIQFRPGLIAPEGQAADQGAAGFPRKYMTVMHAFLACLLTVLPRNA